MQFDRKIVSNSFMRCEFADGGGNRRTGLGARPQVVRAFRSAHGRLVRLSEHSYRLPISHFVVYSPSLDSNAPAMAFRDWLLAEAMEGLGLQH